MFSHQAGHPFQQRCAHSAHSHARLQQESPVFLLLLDCVWQVWHQFPLALEFSEALLLKLATEAYASDYGTFLCNNEQERSAILQSVNRHFRLKIQIVDSCMLLVTSHLTLLSLSLPLRSALRVKDKTHCLFQTLLKSTDREHYSNPLYEPNELAIWPSVHPQSLQLWRGESSSCMHSNLILCFFFFDLLVTL